MTDEENNKLSAEIEIVKEKVLFLILKPYSIDNKKEVSGLLNTIAIIRTYELFIFYNVIYIFFKFSY